MSTLAQPQTGPVLPDTFTRLEHRAKMNAPPPTISAMAPLPVRHAITLLDGVKAHVEDVIAQEKTLRADASLSDVGRKDRYITFVEKRIGMIENTHDSLLPKLRDQVQQLRGALPKVKQPDAMSDGMTYRECETRNALRKLDMAQLYTRFQQAIKDGNEVVFYAIVNDPHLNIDSKETKPLLDKETVERGRVDWVRERAPEAFKQLQEAEMVHDALVDTCARVIQEMREHLRSKFRLMPAAGYRIGPFGPGGAVADGLYANGLYGNG